MEPALMVTNGLIGLREGLDQQEAFGDGFKLYTELSQDEIKALAEAVDALGEPVSKVAEVVSAK